MRKSTAVLSVVVALLAMALTTSIVWQARPKTGAVPKPMPTSSNWPVHTVAAVGSVPSIIPVPRGARSVTISIVCTSGGRLGGDNDAASGGIGINVSGQRGRFSGCDDGEHVYSYPVHYSPGGLEVDISAEDTAHFTFSASFSTATAGPDHGTTIQCTGVSKTFSIVYAAETDYSAHRITNGAWAAQVRNASVEALGILPEHTMLDPEIVAMQDALGDSGVRPGDLYDGLIGELHPRLPGWAAAVNLIEQVCDYNGSGVQVS
jgi:hypothetical protein